MAVIGTDEPARSAGRGVRLATLGLVVFNISLALVVTATLVWLSGRPGLRQRIDLTTGGENTLDVQLQALLDQLEQDVEFHTFFRPFTRPLDEIGADIQERMFEILRLAEDRRPGRVNLIHHPYMPPGLPEGAELLETMRSFGVNEMNSFVVSSGERKTVVKLLGDVADIDLGNPFGQGRQFRPPSLRSFSGQEALAKAILKVTWGERPLAVFSKGHGEREIFSDHDRAMGRLHTALVDDGFRVETWDPSEDGAVPEGCAVLAIVGPEERFSEEAQGWIAEYVRGGGSVIAAPGLMLTSGQGTIADLLVHFGILVKPGFVCRPVVGADGLARDGSRQCALVVVRSDGMLSRHPITEHLRRGDRRVSFVLGRALERGKPPGGGVVLDLLRSDGICWRDLPDLGGEPDYLIDQENEEAGAFTLAMTSVFAPSDPGPGPPPGTNPRRAECRVLAVGSPEAFGSSIFDTNRDFLLNSFNWAASREFRVSITPKASEERRIDIGVDRTLFLLGLISWGILPLLCLGAGAFTVWRRRR